MYVLHEHVANTHEQTNESRTLVCVCGRFYFHTLEFLCISHMNNQPNTHAHIWYEHEWFGLELCMCLSVHPRCLWSLIFIHTPVLVPKHSFNNRHADFNHTKHHMLTHGFWFDCTHTIAVQHIQWIHTLVTHTRIAFSLTMCMCGFSFETNQCYNNFNAIIFNHQTHTLIYTQYVCMQCIYIFFHF